MIKSDNFDNQGLCVFVSTNVPDKLYMSMKETLTTTFGIGITFNFVPVKPKEFRLRVPEGIVRPEVIFIILTEADYSRVKEYPQITSNNKFVVLTSEKQMISDLIKGCTIEEIRNCDVLQSKQIEKKLNKKVDSEGIRGIDLLENISVNNNIRESFNVKGNLHIGNSKKVHIAFTGSYNSIRTSYTAIKEDIRLTNKEVLFMDMCGESYSGYEFKIYDPKESYKWFESPDKVNIMNYVNATCFSEVDLISPFKASNFNPCWLFSLDWEKVFTCALKYYDEIYVFFGALVDSFNKAIFKEVKMAYDTTIYQDGDYLSVVSMLNALPTITKERDLNIKVFNPVKYDVNEPDESKRKYSKTANDKYKYVISRYPNTQFVEYV